MRLQASGIRQQASDLVFHKDPLLGGARGGFKVPDSKFSV
jgi:hypothetical protein